MKPEHLMDLFGDQLAPDGTLVRDNFARWFGQSKVVDVDGAPLKVFHGSSANDIEVFFWDTHFGTIEQALDRNGGPSGTIYEVYLRLQNPKRVRDAGAEWEDVCAQALEDGYDGLVYLNRGEGISVEGLEDAIADAGSDKEFRAAVPSARDSYVIFSSEQVKCAQRNSGLYALDGAGMTDTNVADQSRERMRA